MRGLAKAAGVSIGKLYHYFPDKKSIAQRLFLHVGQQDISEAVQRLSAGMTRPEKLSLLSDFVQERAPRLSATVMLALDHHRIEPAENATRDALRLYRAALTEQLDMDDELVFTVILGMLVRHVLDPEDLDLDKHAAWFRAQGAGTTGS